ncbi:MAG: FtsW/RodA/SpoVE family cell cycle protein [Bacteroidota bacterium]|nr:FtsW/RodA/SpoVE family cell cycle protein [Bacteroidota bacterium]
MNWLLSRTKGDFVIWLIVIVLSLFSLLAVYSSTGTMAYKYQQGNTEYYLLKHLLLMAFGLGLMYGAHKIDHKYYSRIAQIMLYISVPLLFITLLLGVNVNDANRWLTLPGINVTFQTSDLAKLGLILYVARMLSRRQDVIQDLKKSTLPIVGAVLLVCALIAPANLSTAALLFSTCFFLMFIGRMNMKHLGILIGTAFLAVSLFLLISSYADLDVFRVKTWISRIENFSSDNPNEESYQNQQAKIAIATGGFFGKGPGNSIQKNFLPNPYSDFIFAIIIEEYGLLGGLCLISLYLLLLYRSIRIVIKSPKAFGALLAAGLSISLVFQAFINMGVATHLLPVTGLTLPQVSMGGTSLWFTSIAFGIIISVSRDIEELKPETT